MHRHPPPVAIHRADVVFSSKPSVCFDAVPVVQRAISQPERVPANREYIKNSITAKHITVKLTDNLCQKNEWVQEKKNYSLATTRQVRTWNDQDEVRLNGIVCKEERHERKSGVERDGLSNKIARWPFLLHCSLRASSVDGRWEGGRGGGVENVHEDESSEYNITDK